MAAERPSRFRQTDLAGDRRVMMHQGGARETIAFMTNPQTIELAAPIDLARHLASGAAAYARELGFEPRPDLAAGASHLGPWQGSSDITFGRDGKPMYIQGSHDDLPSIIRTLRRSVRDDNFHYLCQIA
jgi:hypothetical protein